MSKENKTSKKDVICSILMLLWFFGSISYMLYVSSSDKNGMPKLLICFGQVFAVMGLVAMVSCIKARQKMAVGMSSAFVLIGLGIMAGGISNLVNDADIQSTMMTIMQYLIPIVFFIIGLSLMSRPIHQYYAVKTKYTDKVRVECIHVNSHLSHSSRQRMYTPVWRGWYHGEYQIFTCNEFSSRKYVVGQSEEILVNPENASEYMDSEKRMSCYVIFGIGIVFFFIGCFILYMFIS